MSNRLKMRQTNKRQKRTIRKKFRKRKYRLFKKIKEKKIQSRKKRGSGHARFAEHSIPAEMMTTAEPDAPSHPPSEELAKGVNLIGFSREAMGLGESCRLAAHALESDNVPYGIIHFNYGSAVMNDFSMQHKEIERAQYKVNIFHMNPDSLAVAHERLGPDVFHNHYNIGYFHWEFLDFPDSYCHAFDLLQEIWVPTLFVLEAVAQKTKIPVVRIPHGIRIPTAIRNRPFFQLPEEQFLFLTMYDTHSYHERKNPNGAIQSFKQAFGPNDMNVGLVIKINNAQTTPQHVEQLKQLIEGYNNIYVIDRVLSREESYNLIQSTDCLVSLHRSEGFGLVLAEAMYLGIPVIATNWSGNKDFMDYTNSCPVRYSMTTVNHNWGPYSPDQIWAEPDLEHSAFYMRRLVEDPIWRQQLSNEAINTIRTEFSTEKSGLLQRQRLTKLGLL